LEFPQLGVLNERRSAKRQATIFVTSTTTILINHNSGQTANYGWRFQRDRNHNVAATAILWFKSQNNKF
jgi:hypothetical protein